MAGDAVRRHRARFERHLGGVLLVLVAEAAEAREPDPGGLDPFGREAAAGARLRSGECSLDVRRVPGIEVDEQGEHVVAAQVGHHHAPGGEHRGIGRHHNLGDAQLLRERHRVHRAAAAEGDEREVARVEAAVDGDQLERVDHVVVGDAHDAPRCLVGVRAEPRAHRLDRPLHRVHVRLHRPAAKIVAVDAAEPEIGVGRGGLGSSAAVGGRARHRTGRARPDAQLAEVIDPRRSSRRRCRSPPDRRPAP